MLSVRVTDACEDREPASGSQYLGTRAALWISSLDAAFAELVQHGGVVDAQVFADSCQGPAEVVEVDGFVDLLGRQAAAAHRHVVAVEDAADRPPLDAESVAQFVHRRAGTVARDQFMDLLVAEPPGSRRPGPHGWLRLGRIEAGSFERSCSSALTWAFGL
jgi:hypothetical protein